MRSTSPPCTDRTRRHPRARRLGLLLLLAISLCAGAAPAQEAISFKDRYERAVAAFKTGQYEDAIAEFQAAYALKPQPLLLFNIAQAHRKAGHPHKALDLYERFLREDPGSELRGEVEKFVAEVQAVIAEEQRAREQAEREKAEREQKALMKALAEEPAPLGFDRAGRLLRPPPRPFRVLKWVAAGAGLLAVAAGATLLGLNGRPTCALGEGQQLCPQQLDTLAGGGVAVGVGAALLGTSAAFFVLDYRQGRAGEKTALLTFTGRF